VPCNHHDFGELRGPPHYHRWQASRNHQLPQDHFQPLHFFGVHLDSLQLHQDFVDQLQVHDFFQVDQIQVHNLFVVVDQALRTQLDILQVHKQQARHLVLPCFDFHFHQLQDLDHAATTTSEKCEVHRITTSGKPVVTTSCKTWTWMLALTLLSYFSTFANLTTASQTWNLR
jgi:hypothetical protein